MGDGKMGRPKIRTIADITNDFVQAKGNPFFRNVVVSKDGRIINRKTGFELKPYKMKKGHLQISLSVDGVVKKFLLHRIIAMTFIENPNNKPCINHINGIPWDNRIENLEWCTDRENKHHAKINNMFQQSTIRYNASFNEFEVLAIHTLKWSQAAIARHYETSSSVICNLVNFKTYSNFAVIK